MTTPTRSETTVIHVIPTAQERQEEVLHLLRGLIDRVLAADPGLRVASLARSLDGARIVMETTWVDLSAMRRSLVTDASALWRRVRSLAARDIDVHVYDQTFTLVPVRSERHSTGAAYLAHPAR